MTASVGMLITLPDFRREHGYTPGDMRVLCVFDLDHTLVRSSLDLRACRADIRALATRRGVRLPEAALGWTVSETIAAVAARVPALEAACWEVVLAHES